MQNDLYNTIRMLELFKETKPALTEHQWALLNDAIQELKILSK